MSISLKNENNLKNSGAKEYGRLNSIILAWLHVVFYLACLVEGCIGKVQFDRITVIGLVLLSFSFLALYFVIKSLGEIWTVKLIVFSDQPINKNWVFKYLRHPNYFFNIIPELTGLCLIFKAWFTLSAVFPLYLVSLAVRIVQEEKIMKRVFADF